MQLFQQSILGFWQELKKYWPLILVLSLAATYRFTALEVLPGGLFPDEAANGLDVNSILKGQHQPFFERGNGRESLFFYLLAPAVLIFGRTPFAHHLVSASVGLAVVLMTYLLMRRWFGARLAFISSFLVAVSSWHVTLSRTAFRANLVPLFTLLFFYFATRVVQSKSSRDYWLSSILAGLSFGLGFYTYISYRMMIPILGFLFIILLIADARGPMPWAMVKKYWKAFAAFVASSLAALAWLVIYFVQNPSYLGGRSGQVSIFSPDLNQGDVWGTFVTVLIKTWQGFFIAGDLNWRHNISGWPFLSYLIAPLFAVGLMLVVFQSIIFIKKALRPSFDYLAYNLNLHRLPFLILTLWFFAMLVPELLTAEGIPHGLRLIGVIPVVFILPALFLEEILTEAPQEKFFRTGFKKRLLTLGLIMLLGAEAIYGANLYFGVAGNSPAYAEAYNSELTEVSDYLRQRNNKEKTYLILDPFYDQTVSYFTTEENKPYQLIDPRSPYKLNLRSGDQVIIPKTSFWNLEDFERNHAGAEKIGISRNRWSEITMTIYEK